MKYVFLLFSIFFASQIFSDPFCDPKVIADQKVFESENLYVLVDYRPRVKGHLLMIPKRHVVRAEDLNEQEWKEIGSTIPKVVKVFKESLGTDQYIILEKNGPKAFQEIPHVHFHLLPVSNQTWNEIFNIVPRKLDSDELQQEVQFFRKYFMQVVGECGDDPKKREDFSNAPLKAIEIPLPSSFQGNGIGQDKGEPDSG